MKLFDELMNKRVMVGFKTGTTSLQVTIATLVGYDDNFIKLATKVPKNPSDDPKLISAIPDIITYSSIESIETITDISNDEIFSMIMQQMDKRLKQAQNNKEGEK